MTDADLTDAVFQDVRGMDSLSWKKLPRGIVRIREEFKNSGERELERQLTFAIKHNERRNTAGIEGIFNYALFEVTSKWGLSPGRPLQILAALIAAFSFFYVAPVLGDTNAGIYRVWSEERIEAGGSDKPERLVEEGPRGFGFALYFSLLSAFHIGWRDLNVGNWIARIQSREYALRATGWVRAVSGVQSLISVYLLALWALTYFGRPFE